MFAASCNAIETLSMTRKEADHRSRGQLGLHVFLSRLFFDFRSLTEEEKHNEWSELVGEEHRLVHVDDDIIEDMEAVELLSVDSNDSPPEPIKVSQIMKLAFFRWRELPPHHIESWKNRASILNARTLEGRFIAVPRNVGNGNILEENVCQSLTCDWEKALKIFRNSLMRTPWMTLSCQTVFFGK